MVTRGLISAEAADQLLHTYGATTPVLPFMILPPNVSLDYMRQERPCLLHAILVGSAQDQLQKRLESDFRKTIAEQVIINSEKSLDMIQGIMIYIAW